MDPQTKLRSLTGLEASEVLHSAQKPHAGSITPSVNLKFEFQNSRLKCSGERRSRGAGRQGKETQREREEGRGSREKRQRD